MVFYWDKDSKKRYMISKWHVLQHIKEESTITRKDLTEYFAFNRLEARTRIDRLLMAGYIKKIRRNSDRFELGKRSIKLLRTYRLYYFLEPENPYLEKSKERCKNMRKVWMDRP